ncbi:MAG TPA: type IV toxin-antitoxin system AbiEi family antitoxin domain-containing protein [Rhodanobacter sp.]
MSEQNTTKLNQLLGVLGDTSVVTSAWLGEHGYARNLVARYAASGWLVSPARGVYQRAGGVLRWDGVVNTLQLTEALAVHVGGRFALSWQGHEHSLRLGEAATVTLYGATKPPGWVGKLVLPEHFDYRGTGPFAACESDFVTAPDEALQKLGLMRMTIAAGTKPVVMAMPERAMLELCDEPPSAALVYEADALMQGLATLRPGLLGALLRECRSIKAKRLFLALAERHHHAWLSRVDLEGVNLGSGKRALVPGGRLHPTYQITLPADLDEQLG